VQHLDVRIGFGKLVGQVPGPIGTVVVDDEQIGVRDRTAQASGDGLQVLPLLIRRHDDGNTLDG
jgi:hypothetical protein